VNFLPDLLALGVPRTGEACLGGLRRLGPAGLRSPFAQASCCFRSDSYHGADCLPWLPASSWFPGEEGVANRWNTIPGKVRRFPNTVRQFLSLSLPLSLSPSLLWMWCRGTKVLCFDSVDANQALCITVRTVPYSTRIFRTRQRLVNSGRFRWVRAVGVRHLGGVLLCDGWRVGDRAVVLIFELVLILREREASTKGRSQQPQASYTQLYTAIHSSSSSRVV